MAILKGGKGRDDTSTGGVRADRFEFDSLDLGSGDTVVGGSAARSTSCASPHRARSAFRRWRTCRCKPGHKHGADAARRCRRRHHPRGSFGALVDGGADAIVIGQGGVVYDPNDLRESTGQGMLFSRGAATIDAGSFADESVGDTAVVTGFQDIDASASRASVTITGIACGSLVGGAGRDTITNGSYLRGGAGADTLTGSALAFQVTFELLKGDFARGEVIRSGGASVFDTLQITGSVDLRIGTVEGIDQLFVHASGARTDVTKSAAQFASVDYVSGEVDANHVIFVHVAFGQGDVAPTRLSSYGATVDLQFSGKNDAIGQYSGNVIIHGGGDDDTITSNGTVFGDDGNDTIVCDLQGGSRDGGAVSDTLIMSGYAFSPVTIDLSARN